MGCSNVAVASQSGSRTFYTNSNIISSSLFGGRKGGKARTTTFEVETVTIGEILKARQPNIIMIDIEGAEVEVLFDVISRCVHIVGKEAIAALESHFSAQGLVPAPALHSANTQAFTRGRQPAF